MKLIIDIPEEIYKASKIIDVQYEDIVQIPLELIKNGISIPDNATNGDVIKAMFPNLKITKMNDSVSVMGEHYEFNNFYPFDFWNAPYQKGGK